MRLSVVKGEVPSPAISGERRGSAVSSCPRWKRRCVEKIPSGVIAYGKMYCVTGRRIDLVAQETWVGTGCVDGLGGVGKISRSLRNGAREEIRKP